MVTRRRPVRAPAHRALRARNSLTGQLARAAVSPTAKIAYVTIGTLGLTALGIAIFGPKRFQRELLQPAGRAVGNQADRIWTESRPLRDQLGTLIEQAGSSREKLVRSLQSWIGHFHAS